MKKQLEAFWLVVKNRVIVFSLIVFFLFGGGYVIKAHQMHEPMDKIVQQTENSKEKKITDKNSFILNSKNELKNPFVQKLSANKKIEDKQELKQKAKEIMDNNAKNIALLGVVKSGTESIAIIEYNKQSNLYKENEAVGNYKIIKIDSVSVVLNGRDQEISLKVMQ